MVYIYVLELAGDKYYIGKTNYPEFRLEMHFTNGGSIWTKKYKALRVLELLPNCDDLDEDKITLKYMKDKGISNVRGGSFCEIKLSDEDIKTLTKMLNGSSDKCYICGETGHYANNCYEIIDLYSCEKCDKEFDTYKAAKQHVCQKCYICQRTGHHANRCYAKTDVYGNYLHK